MPFQRPKLSDLMRRMLADLRASIAAPILRNSNLAVISDTAAALVDGVYAFQAWAARQILPDTAETAYLDRHCRIWGVTRKPATNASGFLTVTGVDGAQVVVGTEFARADGAPVSAIVSAVIAGGTAQVSVVASQAGAAGNAETGTSFRLTAAVSGIEAEALVSAPGLAGGADAETDSALRGRLLARVQRPPAGGAAHDYVAWAKAVAGVTRAWTIGGLYGAGTVGVAVAADDAEDGPIPSAGLVALVQAAIDVQRPVTSDATAFAPTALVVPVEVTGLSPDTPEIRAAVELELQDLFRRDGDLGAVLPISRIWEAVSVAAGERRHLITAPAADIEPDTVELPVLGAVTFPGA
jgi:uncharacterized phage protein gp47/JayE